MRMHALWWSAALVVVASLAGCSLVLSPSRRQVGGTDAATGDGGLDSGLDAGPLPDTGPVPDTGPTPDTGSTPDAGVDAAAEDAGSDAGPACESGLECVPAAPGGWNGPVVLVSGPGSAAAPACPGSAPATAFTAQSGLTAANATCGCTCDPPGPGSFTCGAAQLRNSSGGCVTLGTLVATVANGACQSISGLGSSQWMVGSSAMSGSATCTATPSTTVPPVTYAGAHRGCGFGTPTSCGASSVCAPTRGTGERLCIWVDGDSTCPGAFPVSLSTSSGVTDTRGCSACTCGSVTGSCQGSIDIISSCTGTPILYESIATNGCVSATSAPTPFASASFTPMPSCPPSTPTPTGSAAPTGQRTVCCTS